MSFNQRLKELRLQNNLSQEKLARKLDITTGTYIHYETGKRYPSIKRLTQIAELFSVSIPFLMEGQDEGQAQGGNLGAEQLIERVCALFAGGELSEAEKDAVMEALQAAYWKAKKDK